MIKLKAIAILFSHSFSITELYTIVGYEKDALKDQNELLRHPRKTEEINGLNVYTASSIIILMIP